MPDKNDTNDNKKIDGIKKLSKEDLDRSRKLVLESIGENKKPEAVLAVESQRSGVVDGINRRIPSPEKKQKKYIPSKEKREEWKKEISGVLDSASPRKTVREEPAPDFMHVNIEENAIKTKETITKPDKPAEPVKKTAEAGISIINPFKNDMVKKKIEMEKKKAEAEDRHRAEEESRKLIEAKKKAEAGRKKEAEELKNLAEKKKKREEAAKQRKKEQDEEKRKRREERKERLEKRKKFMKNFPKTLKAVFASAWKRTSFYLSVALISSILFYLLFFIVITRFEVDNPAARFIASRIPIPALVTKKGLVTYYDYIDIKNSFSDMSDEERDHQAQVEIAKGMAYRDLIARYDFDKEFEHLGREDLYDRVAMGVVRDSAINQVPIYRIRRVLEMIDSGEDFVRIATRFGDTLGQVSINEDNKDEYEYSESVLSLGQGELSDIITTRDGYYIFRCYVKTDQSVELSYVFNRAKTIDQYLNEVVDKYEFLSLVD